MGALHHKDNKDDYQRGKRLKKEEIHEEIRGEG
jgi:hypothetical protein